jgi:hypothetical protein
MHVPLAGKGKLRRTSLFLRICLPERLAPTKYLHMQVSTLFSVYLLRGDNLFPSMILKATSLAISRPIAPISSMASGDDTARPRRRQGISSNHYNTVTTFVNTVPTYILRNQKE